MPADPNVQWQYTPDGRRYPANWTPEQIAEYQSQQEQAAANFRGNMNPALLADNRALQQAAQSQGLGGIDIQRSAIGPFQGLKNAILGDTGNIDPGSVYQPHSQILGGAGELGAGQPGLPGNVRDRTAALGAGLGLMGTAAAANPRAAPQAQAAQIGTANLQRTGALESQSRGLQLGNLDRLTAAAEGNVPSAAEIQQQRGLEQSLRNQAAIAASARGGAAASMAARRNAVSQGAVMSGQARQDAAQLRAAEQAQARGLLTGAIERQRASDLGLGNLQLDFASRQAGLQQQANMLNPSLALQSRQLEDARARGYLGLGLQANQAAGQLGLGLGNIEQQRQQMLLNRDLGIQGTNAQADTARTAALFNAGGTVTAAAVSGGRKPPGLG